jgi:hypothetical protein
MSDPDLTFHCDANPDPDPGPNPCFTHAEKSEKKFTLIHSCVSLYSFIFLASVIGVIVFHILDSILKFSVKKYSLTLHLVEIDTDPDPASDQQALDADSDPDLPR